MKIVVDSSPVFSGFQIDGSMEYFTTPSVLKEIRGRRMKIDLNLRIDLIRVQNASSSSIDMVKSKSGETGDLYQLSETDIELVALALDKGAKLLTNDLAIQNVCRKVGVDYESFGSKEIDTEIKWGYRCIGCRRKFVKQLSECPYCGNELKRYPVKRKSITEPT